MLRAILRSTKVRVYWSRYRKKTRCYMPLSGISHGVLLFFIDQSERSYVREVKMMNNHVRERMIHTQKLNSYAF